MLQPGDYFAIHAGKTLDYEAVEQLLEQGIDVPRDTPAGAIVAVVRFAGLYRGAPDSEPYFVGPVGWRLAEVTAIDPVPCRGLQKLWSVPDDVANEVRKRWSASRNRTL